MSLRNSIAFAAAVMLSGSAASAQNSSDIKAWVSGGVGLTSTGGGLARLGVAGALGPAMISVRSVRGSHGFDEDGHTNDRAALFGLRTTGTSYVSASMGRAWLRHFLDYCGGQPNCPVTSASGWTTEIGAHFATPTMSFGLILVNTRATTFTSYHGGVVSIGLGKFR